MIIAPVGRQHAAHAHDRGRLHHPVARSSLQDAAGGRAPASAPGWRRTARAWPPGSAQASRPAWARASRPASASASRATDTGPRAALRHSRHSDAGLQSRVRRILDPARRRDPARRCRDRSTGRSASSARRAGSRPRTGSSSATTPTAWTCCSGSGSASAPPLAVRRLPTTGVPEIVGTLRDSEDRVAILAVAGPAAHASTARALIVPAKACRLRRLVTEAATSRRLYPPYRDPWSSRNASIHKSSTRPGGCLTPGWVESCTGASGSVSQLLLDLPACPAPW